MVRPGKVTIRIRKQDGPGQRSYDEGFTISASPDETVSSLLGRIAANPPGRMKHRNVPVVWEEGCGTGECGSCAMIINGKPMLACRAVASDFPPAPIALEPLSKFPVIRDLLVDRKRVFENLADVEGWIEINEYKTDTAQLDRPLGSTTLAEEYGRCISCGICIETCPGCNTVSAYNGPAAVASCTSYISMARSREDSIRLLKSMMNPGGLTGCGNAMNCVKTCPVGIDLTAAIAFLNSRVNNAVIKSLFGI